MLERFSSVEGAGRLEMEVDEVTGTARWIQRAVMAAEEGGGDGGEGGEEAFGVAGVLVEATGVEGALEEGVEGAVEPGGEVAVGVEEGDVVGGDAEAGDGDEAHERPVADEDGRGEGERGCGDAAGEEAEEADDEITDGDAGEDAVDAEAW